MKHGARNDIPAKVTAIKRGGVMAQVDVMLEGTSNKMSSVMTLELVDTLSLAIGDTVHVLAKAVNVLLMKP